jgi:hypothetical protein
MSKCHSCAYKGNIPGDAHICCKLNWLKVNSDPPKASDHGIRSGWYDLQGRDLNKIAIVGDAINLNSHLLPKEFDR